MSQSGAAATQTRTESTTSGLLRAQLAVTPDIESGCAVVGKGAEAEEINHQLKSNPARDSNTAVAECHTQLTYAGEGGREYFKSNTTAACICPVFTEHDCIPEIKGVKNETVVVVVSVPDRSVLRDVIEGLRDVDASVSVEWLVNGSGSNSTAEIDVSSITSKQQEALETALQEGYYETPRESDLSELSEALGVSESAASQRLNAAETKLVKSFLEE